MPLGLAVLYFNPAFAQPPANTPAGASGMAGAVPLPANGTKVWTLESATRRVLEVAPERRLSDTAVDMHQEELIQAGTWPNPSIDLRADDRIGQLSGQGGTSLAQLALSQPLPFRRIARQRAAAESGLSAAQANRHAQFLLLEHEAARVFHALQFAAAKRQLAKERLEFTNNFAAGRTTTYGDHLKRYLTPLELGRLAVMREEARQAAIFAERDYENARIGFRSLLGLADGAAETALPVLPTRPPSFDVFARELDHHPAIKAARHEMEAAKEGVEVAESQRYADPVLKLFHDRDFNNGATINVTGIGVGIEIPLWSRNRALEGKAKAEAEASRARYDARLRDARARLEQAYAQLSRLQNQTAQMSADLIEPARKVFELTRRSFAAGESNVFALVDANNAYFDARARYQELFQECALALADLRLAAGLSIVDGKEYQP
jgi:cobalt-zinc-cadmium efflux system outer membrane protein